MQNDDKHVGEYCSPTHYYFLKVNLLFSILAYRWTKKNVRDNLTVWLGYFHPSFDWEHFLHFFLWEYSSPLMSRPFYWSFFFETLLLSWPSLSHFDRVSWWDSPVVSHHHPWLPIFFFGKTNVEVESAFGFG